MKKFLRIVSSLWPVFYLVLLESILFVLHYVPNTYVLGWDNMMPELNFGLNLKRTIFAVWQEYRGLGYMDGMSHAANLPHYLFLYLLSFVLPNHALRYVFIFLMHLVGGIGMYVLLRRILAIPSKIVALFGALFYQYNFAVLQMFYLPFEPFLIHFAFLPWLLALVIQYLHHGKRQTILWLTVISFVASSQAHVPTVFLVYAVALAIVFAISRITSLKKQTLSRAALILLITFCTNAYWGLPFTYATLKNAGVIANSKNNQMATDDIFLKNHKYGDLKNTALMRSYGLEFVQYDHTTGQQTLLLLPWRTHIEQPLVEMIYWVYFGLAIAGVLFVVWKRQKPYYPFVALFLFVFAIIGNDIPGVSLISAALRTHVPLFHNVFRFVFTKFFILYALSFTVLLTLTLQTLVHALQKRSQTIVVCGAIACFTTLVIASAPTWRGNFLYKNLRVIIPKEYFELFSFLEEQNPNDRIAVLPSPWFWAWTQYRWAVIGSGFQWFGIPQPLLDRAFDPWSNTNENFYWELVQATYTKNTHKLKYVLAKYHVRWLLLDTNIINASHSRALYVDEIRAMLEESEHIAPVATFGNITLYQNAEALIQSPISLMSNPPNIGPAYAWNDNDQAFVDTGVYVTDPNRLYDAHYPFRTLFTGRNQDELPFTISETPGGLAFSTDNLTVLVPKNLIYDSNTTNDLFQSPSRCDNTSTGNFMRDVMGKKDEQFFRFTSTDSSNCLGFDRPELSQRDGFLVMLESRHRQGKNLLVTITNKDTRRAFLETYLPQKPQEEEFSQSFFVIPPMDPYGQGYHINIDNISIGRQETVNDVKRLVIYRIPYDELVHLRSVQPMGLNSDIQPQGRALNSQLSISHPNPAYYKIEISDKQEVIGKTTIILSQSFHSGWRAYVINAKCQMSNVKCNFLSLVTYRLSPYLPFLFGKELNDHVLVNNWENGWELRELSRASNTEMTIIIFFLPQLLEFTGFALLPLPFLLFRKFHT